jgi:hypothetical protein
MIERDGSVADALVGLLRVGGRDAGRRTGDGSGSRRRVQEAASSRLRLRFGCRDQCVTAIGVRHTRWAREAHVGDESDGGAEDQVWGRWRRGPPPGETVESRLHRLLMLAGLTDDANAMAPGVQPARGGQEGLRLPGCPKRRAGSFVA